jgi:hypothetical protein
MGNFQTNEPSQNSHSFLDKAKAFIARIFAREDLTQDDDSEEKASTQPSPEYIESSANRDPLTTPIPENGGHGQKDAQTAHWDNTPKHDEN